MHGAQADLDPIGVEIAFPEFLQREVDFFEQEHFQEEFAFLGDHPRASDCAGTGRELPGFKKEFLESLNGRRTDTKRHRRFPNGVIQRMVQ
jgi:hypothetical protein